MEIRYDISGDEALIGQWAQAPQIVQEEMNAAMAEVTALLEREVKEKTPSSAPSGDLGGASGLKGSIISEQSVGPEGVIGMVGSPRAYAIPVELGTKPHWAPIQPLKDWVRVKFNVSEEKEVNSIAYAIQGGIAQHGTRAFGMFHRTFAHRAHDIEARFAQARDRIVQRLGAAA